MQKHKDKAMNASYITSYKKNPQITQLNSNKSDTSITNQPIILRQSQSQGKLPVSTVFYDALPYINIAQVQKTKERQNEFFEKTKQNYINDFTKLASKYENPESLELGANILKLNNNYSKKILEYAKKNEITFIPTLQISTKDLQTSVEFADKLFKTLSRHNPNFTTEISCKNTSFQAKKKIIYPLTRDQKAEAHLIIHSASLMCA